MSITSLQFLTLFAVSLALYYLIPKNYNGMRWLFTAYAFCAVFRSVYRDLSACKYCSHVSLCSPDEKDRRGRCAKMVKECASDRGLLSM